jgi:hypothetical protein
MLPKSVAEEEAIDMKPRAYALLIAGVAIAGCVGPSANTTAPGKIVAARAAAGDLAGTWHGFFTWPGGTYWTDDGHCTLRIDRDGAFSATVTPAPGANNLAKASTWTGTAVSAGDRVTLRSSQGPSTTLIRSGERLYGLAEDPIVEVPIAISFERERPAA